jgi:hypothetical protein
MKFKIIKMLVVSLFAAELMGCASSVIESGNFEDISNSDPNKGTIFVYRDKALTGFANQYDVLIDGVLVGSLPNGSFFTVNTEPGKKNIKADTGMGKGSSILVEKNKTYCMKMLLNFNIIMKSADIVPVDNEQCNSEIKSLTKVRLKYPNE